MSLARASGPHVPHRSAAFCAAGPRIARTVPRRRSDYKSTTLLTTYRAYARRYAASRRRAQNVPREREWLFDIVSWELPKTVRRGAATSGVLIPRSAHAQALPRIRTRVRASRRMRTDTPSCFETHRSALGWEAPALASHASRVCPNEAKRGACGRSKDQPAAARNDRRRNLIVSGLLFTMSFATHTCWRH